MSFYHSLYVWITFGFLIFLYLILSNSPAPYGRHFSKQWGPSLNNNWGWFWMELPALLVFPVIVLTSSREINFVLILMLSIWILHYFYRTILFPLKLKTKSKKIPILIIVSAFIFNIINGFFVSYEVAYLSPEFKFGLNTIVGSILFFIGMAINRYSDNKLISLRTKNNDYQIPKGGLFKLISCPNHFGEIMEWLGFAIIVWNLGALSFALWTAFNLIPRSLNHHKWYNNYFSNYPKKRKAVIPFIL